MRELFRTLPLMCAVLLVPVIPFFFFGGTFNEWVREFEENPPAAPVTVAVVVALLATDIVLPVPSSVIGTISGWQLGWWLGTLASWVGMTLGAAIGFALARQWGRPLALWFSNEEDLQRMQHVSDRFGPFVLVLTRAVPVFAEASVLIVGIHRLSWRRFLPAIALSNLGIALAYAAFGDFAQHNKWFPLALGVSIALPIFAAAAAQQLLPGKNPEER